MRPVVHDADQRSFLFSRGGVGTAGWRLGGDGRKDQEARQNSVFAEEVATHHMGHLHRHQGAGGQQQRVLPRSQPEPAQVQFSYLPAGRRLGQRAERHACVNSDPPTRLKRKGRGRLCVSSSQSARGSYGVCGEQCTVIRSVSLLSVFLTMALL